MSELPLDLPQTPSQPRDNSFYEFWRRYPRKVGKRKACVAYAKALKRATAAEIFAGIDRYMANKPHYCDWMHPTTFLNGDHWEDEYETYANGVRFEQASLAGIAEVIKRAGSTWARYRYPRDVLEQCVKAGLLTKDEMEQAL